MFALVDRRRHCFEYGQKGCRDLRMIGESGSDERRLERLQPLARWMGFLFLDRRFGKLLSPPVARRIGRAHHRAEKLTRVHCRRPGPEVSGGGARVHPGKPLQTRSGSCRRCLLLPIQITTSCHRHRSAKLADCRRRRRRNDFGRHRSDKPLAVPVYTFGSRGVLSSASRYAGSQ